MHSKIIQIEPHPIEQPDMISPDYYPADHWFLQSIADYIDDDADDSVQSLIQLFASVCPDQFENFSDPNGRAIVFKDRFARSFLKKQHRLFDAALLKLIAESTAEAFSDNSLAQTLYDLNNAYADRYGIYIQSSGDLRPMADFVRVIRPDTRYCFGGSVDFHA